MNWQYHSETPKSGRRLKLLDVVEADIALDLIYMQVSKESERSQLLFTSEKPRRMGELLVFIGNYSDHIEPEIKQSHLKNINQLLNLIFTDYGWREVRKEISQRKKRQKKSHIELSNDIILRLKSYMQLNKFDNLDQTIDHLLSEVLILEEE